MKKYIVLSVNDNPDYLFYTPLVCWAWRYFGWEPIVFYKGQNTDLLKLVYGFDFMSLSHTFFLKDIDGYRADTITQISRLYAGCILTNDPMDYPNEGYPYAMTGDIDMIPLSDYWKADTSKITVYGHDLTGFGHYPICYIGMPVYRWNEVMNLFMNDYNRLIKRDLDTLPQAKNPDFYKYWFSDQDLITARLKEYGTGKIDFINRGQYPNGYAKGRVDRGTWTLDHKEFIDCHMLRDIFKKPENLTRTMELLKKIWPGEDFSWFINYTEEYKKLV